MEVVGTRRPWNRRLTAVGIAAGLVTVLVALGLAFTNANSARDVAYNSQLLQWANASAATAAVDRAALNQALVFAVDHDLGVASREAARIALAEARATNDELAHWVDVATADVGSLATDLTNLHADGAAALAALEAGDTLEADAILSDRLEPAYALTRERFSEAQMDFAAEIVAAETASRRVEQITGLMITLLIPAAAIVIHQIVVRRQYRERKLEMDTRLEAERELNRAKDEFIAGLSHELRTPLTSIYGFSEYLLEHGTLDGNDAGEMISLINRDSAELARMVEDLLAAARLEAGGLRFEQESVDLKMIAAEEAARTSNGEGRISLHGEALYANADSERVRHVIRNLVHNAVQHGGPRIDVTFDRNGERARVTVADDGPGVDPDLQDRLFEKFVFDGRETLLTGTMGLGLAVANALVREMDGSIAYERTLGWTNFSIELPIGTPDTASQAAAREPDLPAIVTLPTPSERAAAGAPLAVVAAEAQPQPPIDIVTFEDYA